MMSLLLSYYGDDLTGSTDVMEALSLRGVSTVLFIRQPTEAQYARFEGVRAVGIAGTSRSESPAWMRENLPGDLEWLAQRNADWCHYKVCSTFDSAPETGNIGVAMEIGHRVVGGGVVPIVIGAPQLRRYTAFGQLFAAYQTEIYRIDRHPVMARHPVTPMSEADIVVHLSHQTDARIGHVDHLDLRAPDADERVSRASVSQDALLLDVLDEESQIATGQQLLRLNAAGSRFVVGSSGVEYALTRAWSDTGMIPGSADFPSPGGSERIAVVSGSVSPTTERQIRDAEAAGFLRLAIDPMAFVAQNGVSAIEDTTQRALQALREGKSVIIHTAMGPASDIGKSLPSGSDGRHAIGRGLGRLLARLVKEAALKRVVIAGGDTSSHALREMGIYALTTCLPLPQTPGSPLCTAHSDDPVFDGLQVALKGGQVGNDRYFSDILDGKC